MIKLSRREWLIGAVLLALFLGAAYHMGFYAPLQKELAAIEIQTQALDEQLEAAAAQVAQMEQMRAELENTLFQSEVAPYDNKEAVLHQLNRILNKSEEYHLTFLEPVISADGMVRRGVVMDFTCADFASAQAVIAQLTGGPWRCLVGNLALTGTPDVMSGPVHISATATFFENTRLIP